MKKTLLIFSALMLFTGLASAAEYTGNWTSSSGQVTVFVDNCGNNLCATITDLAKPISEIDGKPKIDRKNPNESLKNRPIIGIQLLSNMMPTGKNSWSGSIYNPDDGKTYQGNIKLFKNKMVVSACVLGVLCKKETFFR